MEKAVIRRKLHEGITVTPRDGELAEVSSAGTVSVLFTNDKAVTGNVSLLKTDGNGKKLQGAEFTLYRIDQNSGYTEIGVYTTDKDGIINISSLEFGEYKLEETKAPSGYELDEAWVQFFTVSDQNGGAELLF